MTEVYVVFGDVYEARDVNGIFWSLEAAQAAYPGDWCEYHPGRWSRDNKGQHESNYREIAKYEISGSAPTILDEDCQG